MLGNNLFLWLCVAVKNQLLGKRQELSPPTTFYNVPEG